MDKSIKGLPTISASKIKTYRLCARKYYNSYKVAYAEREKEDKSVNALLGTALHKAIELHYKDGKSATGVFQEVMTETLDAWQDANETVRYLDYYPRAMKVGKEILLTFDWDRYNPIELEYSFTLPFPNDKQPIANMTGYIDLIDITKTVVDFKSASVAPIQDELDNDPQFFIYYWAYWQMQGYPPEHVYWHHLRTNRLYDANIAHQYDFKLEQLTLDIQAMLQNTHFARKRLDRVCINECSFYELCYGKKAPIAEESVMEV